MAGLEKINEFMQRENTTDFMAFQKICRKLLKMTFIVKEKNEEHRKDFNFIRNHQPEFSEYFGIMGYDVMCDTDTGVAMLKNLASAGEDGSIQMNRKHLKLSESIVLTALWLKYEEAMTSGSLTRAVIISKQDLDYQLERAGLKTKIDKTSMKEILRLFESYNLIEVIGEVGEIDCKIKIFTSMQFGLSEGQFRSLAEDSMQRIMERAKGASDGYSIEEDGETDE